MNIFNQGVHKGSNQNYAKLKNKNKMSSKGNLNHVGDECVWVYERAEIM